MLVSKLSAYLSVVMKANSAPVRLQAAQAGLVVDQRLRWVREKDTVPIVRERRGRPSGGVRAGRLGNRQREGCRGTAGRDFDDGDKMTTDEGICRRLTEVKVAVALMAFAMWAEIVHRVSAAPLTSIDRIFWARERARARRFCRFRRSFSLCVFFLCTADGLGCLRGAARSAF